MNKPSKKEIRTALEQMKNTGNAEHGKPDMEAKAGSLSPKMNNRRIGSKKV